MGVSGLRKLAAITDQPLREYEGDIVCVDAHHYLYKQINIVVRYSDEELYTTENGEEVPNLVALIRGLPPILDHDLTPVFVFDGDADPLKQDEIEDREAKKEEAKEKMQEAIDRGDTQAAKRYKAQTQSMTETVIETSKELLTHLGIPYLDAPKSGEAYAAQLVANGPADAVMTDDYDALLFRSPTTLRQYSGEGVAEQMLFEETLSKNRISHEQLIDIALLCGTDYNEGIHGIGPKRGLKKVRQHGDLETVLEYTDGTIENIPELRSIFLDPKTGSIPTSIESPTPDYEMAVAYATNWGVPTEEAMKILDRFPES